MLHLSGCTPGLQAVLLVSMPSLMTHLHVLDAPKAATALVALVKLRHRRSHVATAVSFSHLANAGLH
jgi:hypothetical protein